MSWRSWPPSTRTLRSAFLCAAVVVIASSATWRPRPHGDGFEYLVTLEAFARHLSPDIRPGDWEALANLLGAEAPSAEVRERCLLTTAEGSRYTLHFWLYPLIAVPARLLLGLVGANPLAAMQVTNTALALGALYFVLFHGHASRCERGALAGLATVSPILWYLKWPHPEVLCWSLGMVSAMALLSRRYPLAALCAAIAAAQNPPLALVSIASVSLALIAQGRSAALRTALAAAPAALAPLFYLATFGVPNPLVAGGATDLRLMSWSRTWSFLSDLNLGLLPWVPGVFVVVMVALAAWPFRRSRLVAALALAVLGMIKLSEVTNNWNAGAAGLIRYAVWMLPFLAAIAARGLPARRLTVALLLAGVLGQALVVAGQGWRSGYLSHTPLARWVLTHHPGWYDPDPEIFAERLWGAEIDFREKLPLDFLAPDGTVSKALLDPRSCRAVHHRYRGDEAFFKEAYARCAVATGFFYLEPAPGTVRQHFRYAPRRRRVDP